MRTFPDVQLWGGQCDEPLCQACRQNKGCAPSRVGRKAISGYFSPQMSLALHMCARRNGMSLQALMVEAFDDALRKYGESPVGE